jgi:Restriction endonuclease
MLASTLAMLFPLFDLIFDFWPILILAPLQNRKNGLKNFVFAWGIWAIIRIFLIFNPNPNSKSLLIPEPLSTSLFFTTGFILIFIWLASSFLGRINLRSKLFGLSSDDLVELSPGEFEEMAAELYRLMGHRARRTRSICDHGVDVVVNAKNGEKWVVQCKRWRTLAGESIVRDFYGMMQHEKAAQGAIIATSGFTQPAIKWAKGKPLYLYNGNDFLRLMKKAKKQQGAPL